MDRDDGNLSELLKQAEIKRTDAETDRIEAERLKLESERRQIDKSLAIPWFKNRTLLQAMIGGLVAVPLACFQHPGKSY
ncbi:hypothetical protein ACFL6S_20855 [Candidatus Poribacteria bacterium]